jgi:hypothetical protein
MSLEDDFRRSIEIGLKAGWLQYPDRRNEIVPKPTIITFKREIPQPKGHKCRKCFHIWFDGARSCPKCLGEQFTLVGE